MWDYIGSNHDQFDCRKDGFTFLCIQLLVSCNCYSWLSFHCSCTNTMLIDSEFVYEGYLGQ